MKMTMESSSSYLYLDTFKTSKKPFKEALKFQSYVDIFHLFSTTMEILIWGQSNGRENLLVDRKDTFNKTMRPATLSHSLVLLRSVFMAKH
ncbi:CLUMA_CG021607, isoform A [Clunio marinus]|uniref:CLUMA_CG021607, isoform A n=1 Tax=Clunio marinus TaxID=568069 RepID=A0A1J1J874_9DIPT|nr:CLUMA_CG021607, isoform A [Clunio marinus]